MIYYLYHIPSKIKFRRKTKPSLSILFSKTFLLLTKLLTKGASEAKVLRSLPSDLLSSPLWVYYSCEAAIQRREIMYGWGLEVILKPVKLES
jgi:hypothetical protein